MKQEEENSQAVYFKSLTVEGINCFKSEQTIDLMDDEGNPAMWTVILGNNNTGKTTLLRCLAGMETIIIPIQNSDKHNKRHRGLPRNLSFLLEQARNTNILPIKTDIFATLDNFWLANNIILNSSQINHNKFNYNTANRSYSIL